MGKGGPIHMGQAAQTNPPRQHLMRWILVVTTLVFILLIGRCTVRKVDRTSSAEFISDSPDGKYRLAVFCKDGIFGGHPEYEAGLFEARWPHRELPGTRTGWNNDSLGSSDFRVIWNANSVDLNYSNGKGEDRDTLNWPLPGGMQR